MDEEKVLTPFEQLTEYCDCQDIEEKDVNELIDLISTYTCWTQHPCETFLKSERREVKDLPNCICDDCFVYEFEPFYVPFDPDSFEFTLVEVNGITETLTTLSAYAYSEVDGKFRLELPLPNCKCKPRCGCESTYKLLVEYVAGYEEIPECLLPLMCEAVYWIHDKNKCDCEDCEACDKNNNYSVHEIDYTTIDGRLQEHFLNILTKQYFNQLSLISLCQRYRGELWGVVV